MSGDRLNADTDLYGRAAGENGAPPTITSDHLVAGLTPVEQLLRVLGLAANADDSGDTADSVAAQAERDIQMIADAEAFAAEDRQASAAMTGVAGPDQVTQMAQQIPQLISGIAGAITGALGGALQPLVQIPQQLAQAATQTGTAVSPDMDAAETPLMDDFGADFGADLGADFGADFGGGSGGGGGAGGFGGTAPTALLGPPPIPSASTAPAAAPAIPMPATSTPSAAPSAAGGMAGVPMIPPGAMQGGATGDRDTKSDTKRVSVPPVPNGSPVQGRLTAPQITPAVTTTIEGKPVATKRIIGLDAGKADTAG
jgi:hypothetical protein